MVREHPNLEEIGRAMESHGWTLFREVSTLVGLVRCKDAEVSLRAIETLKMIAQQCGAAESLPNEMVRDVRTN